MADVHQGRGVGSTLATELAADARAAGIRELVANVCGDNAPMVSVLRRLAGPLRVTWQGGEREIVVALDPVGQPSTAILCAAGAGSTLACGRKSTTASTAPARAKIAPSRNARW